MTRDEGRAAARWQRLVSDRLDEMARLRPAAGSVSGSFWDGDRAQRYAAHARLAEPDRDPFLRALRRATDTSSSAIDVGAGTGRYALPLAASIAHVTAVDPSAAMLDVLRREAAATGTPNVTTVQSRWEEADVEPADVAFSSYVLALVADAPAFVRKLEAAARNKVLLYVGAFCADAVLDPLWRHFHETPRTPGPSYLDALAVLREIGIAPRVKVVELPNRRRFATVAEAAEHYRDWLFLDDTPAVRRELEELLSTWLLGRRGALRPPLRTIPAAIVDWVPRAGS